MPRKALFSKETIIKAGLKIVRDKGIGSVTARSLASELNCSLSPLFTVFKNMDEIKTEMVRYARASFLSQARDALNYTPAFKEYGLRIIRYAVNKPELFRLVFLSRSGIDDDYVSKECINSIMSEYSLSDEQASSLFRRVWIFTCGLAIICSSKSMDIDEDEVSAMLTDQFMTVLRAIKSGVKDECTVPMRKDETGVTFSGI